ncbi:MAG: AMP-binding protein [Chitinophagales bacterium]
MAVEIKAPIEMFYKWEKERANKTFLRQPYNGQWHHTTWKQAGEQIRSMATYLKSIGIEPGDKVAIISKNCDCWIMADLAIAMVGGVSVPLYPTISADMINHILKHSESKAIFVGKLDNFKPQKAGIPEDVHPICFSRWPEGGYKDWDSIVAENEPMQGEPVPDMDSLITIIYTSGTTGMPKGVMHRYSAISSAASWAFEELKEELLSDGSERFFSYLPLSHIAERVIVEMGGLYSGSMISFAESIEDFPKNLADTKPTVFLSVPRLWTVFQSKILEKMPQKKLDILLKLPIINGIVKNKIKSGLGLQHAKLCFTGAAPLSASTMKWYDTIGIEIFEAYGMTENGAYSHINRKGRRKIGSVGRAWDNVEHKIGEGGEILVKSAANMVGYYKEPEMTAESFTEDGFLKTGDQGKIDNDGFLYITGRVKDIFKTDKGKYVAPAPIELAMSKNTDIEQVCLVGTSLVQPIALVVLNEDARTKPKEEIASKLEKTLKEINATLDKHEKTKKFVVIQDVWSVENNILTPTLKIKRNEVDNKYKDNYQSWYDAPDTIVWE